MGALGNGVDEVDHAGDFLRAFAQAFDALFGLGYGGAYGLHAIDGGVDRGQGAFGGIGGVAGGVFAQVGALRHFHHHLGGAPQGVAHAGQALAFG